MLNLPSVRQLSARHGRIKTSILPTSSSAIYIRWALETCRVHGSFGVWMFIRSTCSFLRSWQPGKATLATHVHVFFVFLIAVTILISLIRIVHYGKLPSTFWWLLYQNNFNGRSATSNHLRTVGCPLLTQNASAVKSPGTCRTRVAHWFGTDRFQIRNSLGSTVFFRNQGN